MPYLVETTHKKENFFIVLVVCHGPSFEDKPLTPIFEILSCSIFVLSSNNMLSHILVILVMGKYEKKRKSGSGSGPRHRLKE